MPVPTLTGIVMGEYGPGARFGGLYLEPIPTQASVSPFELSLIMAEIDGQLTAKWKYATDIFTADSIARMAQVTRVQPDYFNFASPA